LVYNKKSKNKKSLNAFTDSIIKLSTRHMNINKNNPLI